MDKDILLRMKQVLNYGNKQVGFNNQTFKLGSYRLYIIRRSNTSLMVTLSKVNDNRGITYFFKNMRDFKETVRGVK